MHTEDFLQVPLPVGAGDGTRATGLPLTELMQTLRDRLELRPGSHTPDPTLQPFIMDLPECVKHSFSTLAFLDNNGICIIFIL